MISFDLYVGRIVLVFVHLFIIIIIMFQLTGPAPRSLRPPGPAAGRSSTPGSPGGRSESSQDTFPLLTFLLRQELMVSRCQSGTSLMHSISDIQALSQLS